MSRAKKHDRVYLEDILSAMERIELYTADGKGLFFRDGKTQDAVIRQISVIGEASAKLPVNVKAARPEIPWREIIGMRNLLIHDYAQTDLPTVWIVVERDLPALRRAVESLLEGEAT